jgi:hypothetical protein
MNIFFEDYEMDYFPDRRNALKVRFKDKAGQKYMWTPKWADLNYVFLLAYTVERLNKGGHFKPLVEVAEEVFTHYKEFIENPKPGYDRWGWKTNQNTHE